MFQPTVLLSAAGAALWLCATPSTFQDPKSPSPFVIAAGSHDIVELIDRAAVFLGRNYLYAESEMAGIPDKAVKLQHSLTLDAAGCEEIVSQLAYAKNLVMVPRDAARGVYEWIHCQGPRRHELTRLSLELTPKEVLAKRRWAIPVVTTLPLSHLEPAAAVNMLRPLFAMSGAAGAGTLMVTTPTALVLQGLAPDVAGAIDLVAKLDTPPAAAAAVAVTVVGADDLLTSAWAVRVEQRLKALEAR